MRPNHWLKLAMVSSAHLVLFVVALYLLQLLGILSKSRHHAPPQGLSQLNTAGHSSKPGSQRETITTGRYHTRLLVTPTLHFTHITLSSSTQPLGYYGSNNYLNSLL